MARHFPIGYHRRLGVLLLASLTALALTTPLASAEDDLKDKHRSVERKIDGAEHDLEASSARAHQTVTALRKAEWSLRKAQSRLHDTRVQLAAAERRDARMGEMLDAAQRKLSGARAELRLGQENVAEQKTLIALYVADLYQKGDPRLIGFAAIADAGDPGDMMRAIAFNDAYNDHENAVLGNLEEAERALASQEAKVEERKGEVAESRAAAADNLTAKERLEKQASAQRSEVQKLVDEKAAIHAVAARARASDRAALARLHNEEKRIAAILRRRAQEALRNGAPGRSDGYLSYPVNGPITSPYGYRIHPIYGDRRLHNGVDFGAGCGQPLFAGAAGVVVARGGGDWDPSGNYLFIDHGGVAGVGLSTSYSHATSYIVSVGQRVKRGQTVGYVGSTGWSTGCHLHFTVKENGVNVDPMKWF